jgi:acyl transferase domain-containing protein
MLSKKGKVMAFDSEADGYIRGEGAGAIVLADLKIAQLFPKHGINNEILVKVASTFLNQDGRSASFTAPNGLAQRSLLQNALKRSKLNVDDIVYIESHGTGI